MKAPVLFTLSSEVDPSIHPDLGFDATPKYSLDGDSGFEVYAKEDVTLYPFVPTLIRHGVCLATEPDFDFCLRPRSSTLSKRNIHVQYGTIDTTYRGELGTMVMYVPPLGKLIDNSPLDLPGRGGSVLPEDIGAVWARVQKMIAAMTEPIVVKKGERISQMVISPVVRGEFEKVTELPESVRGTAGWGSTGGHA